MKNPTLTKEQLQIAFGSEEVIGIEYQDIHRDGHSIAILPRNHGEMGKCTNCAEYVVNTLGYGAVFGFATEDNPTATHDCVIWADGHDFAVISGQYIVDIWISLYTGMEPKVVYDLKDPEDHEKILEIYGDVLKWKVKKDGAFKAPSVPERHVIFSAKRIGETLFHVNRLLVETEGELDGIELRKSSMVGNPNWVILQKDPIDLGKVRFQMFDKYGFYDHWSYEGFDKALEAAVQSGYLEIDRGALTRVSSTPDFSPEIMPVPRGTIR